MSGVRDIHHHNTGVLLPSPVLRRIVGAVIQERWSILRKRPLALELADEFQLQLYPRSDLPLERSSGVV